MAHREAISLKRLSKILDVRFVRLKISLPRFCPSWATNIPYINQILSQGWRFCMEKIPGHRVLAGLESLDSGTRPQLPPSDSLSKVHLGLAKLLSH